MWRVVKMMERVAGTSMSGGIAEFPFSLVMKATRSRSCRKELGRRSSRPNVAVVPDGRSSSMRRPRQDVDDGRLSGDS